MANFVLVAGTFHGGWYWDPVTSELLNNSHSVYSPTLSGLDGEIQTSAINLDTHIGDIVQVIESHSLDDVILVGSSYGGMVITGVADKARGKIKKLIYLDGQLPRPGEREFDLMPSIDCDKMLAQCLDGLNIYPDEWFKNYEPRTRPHPLATKLQPINYDQKNFDGIPKVFIFAEKWFYDTSVTSPLKRSFDLASKSEGWEVQSWPYGHDLVRECKERVIALLLDQAN
jgi:pimeloyl-ACP methyl ester carboxylesterase